MDPGLVTLISVEGSGWSSTAMASGEARCDLKRSCGPWRPGRPIALGALGLALWLVWPAWRPSAVLSVPISTPRFPDAIEGSIGPPRQIPEPGPAFSTAAEPVKLRCRINSAPWQPCVLEIDRVGEHWWLVVGARRFEFRHDGRGQVILSDSDQGPRPVAPEWRGQGVLCWQDLCAEGAIPLD